MMRRSNSGAPPRSGDSLSSNGSYQPRRKKSRGKSNGSLIRFLLLIVFLLATLDLVLFWRKHHPTTTASSHFTSFQLSHAESQQLHEFVEQQPPIPATGTDDDTTDVDVDVDVDADKEPVYEILRQANIDPKTLDYDTRRQLPTWSTIQRLFGTEPRIYGLDTCHRFREITDPSLTFLAMAGTFNSGTNLLASLMIQNCQIEERMRVYGEKQKGMRWQVKWGKHTPPKYRETHMTTTDKDVPLEYTLPLITIRDPYNWMQSMCRHPYEAHWTHSKTNCPHVWDEPSGRTSVVHVDYRHTMERHDSLPGMWNDWYNAYMEVEYPRVFVRMEDLIFYGKNVTETLCQCGGGVPRQRRFKHIASSAKLGTAQHGNDKTSLLSAIIRYGTEDGRLKGMTPMDLQMTRKLLDPNLMHIFNYSYA